LALENLKSGISLKIVNAAILSSGIEILFSTKPILSFLGSNL